jgi:hypothetical protein
VPTFEPQILTPEEVAALVGASPTEQMEALIPYVEEIVQRECNVYVQAERTEIRDGAGDAMVLVYTPVVMSPSAPFEIRIATDAGRKFENVDPVDEDTYFVDEENGIVHYDAGFPCKRACVRLVYTGGYLPDDFPKPERLLIAELVSTGANLIANGGFESESAGQYSYSLPTLTEMEQALSPLGRMTLENGRARSNSWVR